MDTTFYAVRSNAYAAALAEAKTVSPAIAHNVDEPPQPFTNFGHYCLLTDDAKTGYYLKPNDGEYSYELCGVFSLVKGRGGDILTHACSMADAAGAMLTLNCFDGYLVELYGRYGFIEYERTPNWTVGEPDIVHMYRVSPNV
jgi:hypothetical protein